MADARGGRGGCGCNKRKSATAQQVQSDTEKRQALINSAPAPVRTEKR